jgi:HrpA-like RNA helicase
VAHTVLQDRQQTLRMQRQQEEFRASDIGREWVEKRAQLPVYQVREQLLQTLSHGHCAVLSGDTGCGKTTQVPQFLLEHEIESGRGAACNIICTQPRRIAAMSVADRVAQERAEPPPGKRGSRVGCASPA